MGGLRRVGKAIMGTDPVFSMCLGIALCFIGTWMDLHRIEKKIDEIRTNK